MTWLRRHAWTLLGLILVVVLTAAYIVWRDNEDKRVQAQPETRLSQYSSQGINFKYPVNALSVETLTSDEAKDRMLAHLKGRQTSISVTAQYESGLNKVSLLLKRDPFELVVENSSKVLQAKYPGYKQISQRTFEQSGHQAAEIIFDYQGKDSTASSNRVRQRLLIIMKGKDKAYYRVGQTRANEFNKLNSEVLDPIFKSFKLN